MGQMCLRAKELAIQATNLFVVLFLFDLSVIFIHSFNKRSPNACYMIYHTPFCAGRMDITAPAPAKLIIP